MNYANVTYVLSELIRTAFIAAPGHTFHVCDFSAIECRVIAWLAGEQWVLDVFRQGGDIYCATASQMFNKPVEKHGQNAELRQKGKIATLALGYGGGVSALEAMGGKRLGLTESEEKEIVNLWRNSNPKIVKMWATIEKAAITALKTGKTVPVHRGIEIGKRWGMLTITLPSGRVICYPRANVGIEYGDGWRGDHEIIEYEGLNQTTKKWGNVRTYGGKLTENIVQAIARRDHANIMPSANTALHQLGFTTQVPTNYEYLTNGAARIVHLDKNTVRLKHGVATNFAYRGKLMPLLHQALQAIGKVNITNENEAHVAHLLLAHPEPRTWHYDLRLMPVWERAIVEPIITNYHE